jgi:SAM-dependent methyltransferase
MLPKLVDRLDLRPRVEAELNPLLNSVNIPADELDERVFELPRPSTRLRIFDPHGHRSRCSSLSERIWELETEPDYGSGPRCRLWDYNETLDLVGAKTPGTALDLGCGSGRDAVALASMGWAVTACDHLERSLEMARSLESVYCDGSPIQWVAKDLRERAPVGRFDLICSFFFWQPRILVEAVNALNPGGVLAIEMFTHLDREKHGKPKHTTSAVEIRRLFGDLREIAVDEDWRFGRHTVRYVAAVA